MYASRWLAFLVGGFAGCSNTGRLEDSRVASASEFWANDRQSGHYPARKGYVRIADDPLAT